MRRRPPDTGTRLSKPSRRELPPHILRRRDVMRHLGSARSGLSDWVPWNHGSATVATQQDTLEAEAGRGWDGWLELLTSGTGVATGAGYTALLALLERLHGERARRTSSVSARRDGGPGFIDELLADDSGLSPEEEWRESVRVAGRELERIGGRVWALEHFISLYELHGVYGPWEKLRAEHAALWPEDVELLAEDRAEDERLAALEAQADLPPGGFGREAAVKEKDHERTLAIGLAFLDLEQKDPEAARFNDQNEQLVEWAAGVLDVSTGTVRAALKGAGVFNGEGKAGSPGRGLGRRMENLRAYVLKHDPEGYAKAQN